MGQELSSKVIVLTGASSGFGKGAALKFAGAGATVVVAARRGELLDELVQECEALGDRALAVPTDVSKQSDVEQLAQAAISTFGRIDVWVNDAGVGAQGRFEDIPLADHVQVIETNLIGTLYGSYFAIKQFQQQADGGTLINVASVVGKIPQAYMSSYVASKHGIVGLCGVIRQELAVNKVENIHLCVVMPAAMDTPFFIHQANYTGHEAVPPPPVYDPQMVVEAIFDLATNPKDEVPVGPMAATGGILMHQIAPSLVEAGMAKNGDKTIKDAPPAPDTDGSVREPIAAGNEVSGGWKK